MVEHKNSSAAYRQAAAAVAVFLATAAATAAAASAEAQTDASPLVLSTGNSTPSPSPSPSPSAPVRNPLLGYGCALVSVVFFGSNFVPVKKFETGDGIFFQWVLCTGVFITGLIVNIALGFPKFQPWAMLGGAIWCTGNIMSVPVIKMIGLSMGLLIWGGTNMLTGWASSTFGIIVNPEPVANKTLNYVGVLLALTSFSLFILIKNEDKTGRMVLFVSADLEREGRGDSLSSALHDLEGVTSVRVDTEESKIFVAFNSERSSALRTLIPRALVEEGGIRGLSLVGIAVLAFIPDVSKLEDDDDDDGGNNSSGFGNGQTSLLRGGSGEQKRLLSHWHAGDYASMTSGTPRILAHDPERAKPRRAFPANASAALAVAKAPSFGKDLHMLASAPANGGLATAGGSSGISRSKGRSSNLLALESGNGNGEVDNAAAATEALDSLSEVERAGLLRDDSLFSDDGAAAPESVSWVDLLPNNQKRLLGIGMAMISGVLYGSNFTPNTVVQEHGGDPEGIHYVFSHFCGIFLASTTYMLLYAAVMRNKPLVNREVILPAFVSGVMWAVAQTSWFVANDNLQLNVAFPIITTGPGLVAALWGVLVFQEITGARNYGLLIVASTLTIISGICVGMSKG